MRKIEIQEKKNILLKKTLEIPENFEIKHDLIKEFNEVHLDINLKYIEDLDTLLIDGKIFFSMLALDSRLGNEFIYSDTIDWDDEYILNYNKISAYNNYIIGDEIDILSLACEQIYLNIPINLSNNYDKILNSVDGVKILDEEEYLVKNENTVDPRWEKLKDLDLTKKK